MQAEKTQWGLDMVVSERSTHTHIRFLDTITSATQLRLADIICGMSTAGGKTRFLVNTQGCPIDYPLIERYMVASAIAEKFGSRIRVAYVIDAPHLTGLVENAARNRGASGIRVTPSEKDGLAWIEAEAGA